MSLYELVLLAPVDTVETLSDALDALSALSVSVEDADAQTPAEQALFGEPGMPPPKAGWERSRVAALFADEKAAREAAALLQRHQRTASCVRCVQRCDCGRESCGRRHCNECFNVGCATQFEGGKKGAWAGE